ncbi:carbohydrate-binding protein, partial [Clostridioides difficile]|uniref:carbohydrate-binding protein n=1 Tax=Clostridioides difficile TaxID=1496 RepID=UPI0018DE014B
TLRGIGITAATKEIQIDRYSKIADKGISISFIDTTNKFLGWKTSFAQQGAWIQYNTVDFGIKPLKSVIVKAVSTEGGILQIRVNSIDGPVIAEVKISKT